MKNKTETFPTVVRPFVLPTLRRRTGSYNSVQLHSAQPLSSRAKATLANKNKGHRTEEHVFPIELFNNSVRQQKSPHSHGKKKRPRK